jgi:D-sedoheptulose 7-phosphate isomerase
MSGAKENLFQLSGSGAASPEEYFGRLSRLIPQLPYAAIEGIARALLQAFTENRTVFVFGNGGSAAAASHMMVDMNKGTAESAGARRLKVMALTDNVPVMTAWANDYGYEHVFSEQLKNFVQRRDVAFAISASGNSANVVLALEAARERGAVTVGLTGYRGGKMQTLCDVCAVVPCDDVQMIEDIHHAMLHSIFSVVRKRVIAWPQEAMVATPARFKK